LEVLLESGFGVFSVDSPNFGIGRIDLRSGANTGDATWLEGYIETEVKFRFEDIAGGQLYGGVSGIGALTGGDGDAGGFTNGDAADIDLEKLYAGWKSHPIKGWALDVSGGRQDVHLGSGFLIYDGNFDTATDGTFWLAPRSAFSNTAVVNIDNETFDLTGFYFEADKDQDRSELAGVDGNFKPEWGRLGALYAHVLDSNDIISARKGMDIVDLRATGLHAWSLSDDLTFSAEYVAEFGSGGGNSYDACAFYAGAAYTASSWRTKPSLSYRYFEFSGADIGDTKIKSFDPLFYGSPYDFAGAPPDAGYGSWFLGEITGQHLLFNSNERVHMIQLKLKPLDPVESLEIGAIYYHFELDKKNYFGAPVTSRNFADEVDLFANWAVNDRLYISAIAALAEPNGGARQAFGDDDTIALFEVYAQVKF
jgi:hypothetical protein